MILLKDHIHIYENYQKKYIELQKNNEKNGGMYEQDFWRMSYYKYPYLLLESDEAILTRLVDILTNGVRLTEDGKLSPEPLFEENKRLSKYLIEVIEETNWRGIITKDYMYDAMSHMRDYFKDGTPLGVKMFKNKSFKNNNYLIKFSKLEYIKEMYKFGRFRISPASFYSKGSHIKAIRDLEVARDYKLKAIVEVVDGKTEIEHKGVNIPIINGIVPMQFMMDDYYLLSLCSDANRRMPTDFESDAALVIRDKDEFINLVRRELRNKILDWEFMSGDVYYYDQYNDFPKDRNQEFWKNIAYSYQREYRFILKNKYRHNLELRPFFIEIGSLAGIAEILQ